MLMDLHNGNVDNMLGEMNNESRAMETLKKMQKELLGIKNTLTEVKNDFDGYICRLGSQGKAGSIVKTSQILDILEKSELNLRKCANKYKDKIAQVIIQKKLNHNFNFFQRFNTDFFILPLSPK